MKPNSKWILFLLLIALALLAGCNGSDSSSNSDDTTAADPVDQSLLSKTLSNDAPYLPPQCYTRTIKENGEIYNSCYTCHTKGLRPDFINDGDLQLEFALPAYTETNHWTNLFKDRSDAVAAISDETMIDYISRSNYVAGDGTLLPAETLSVLPPEWDVHGDGTWDGYTPDCRFNFDDNGFDRTADNGYTGWRAFAYYPFPATHWPTNGDYADVLIRMPELFQTRNNTFDLEIYRLNLAILEALIKKQDVIISPVDETLYGVDLDKDGALDTADTIVYDWAPNEGRYMSWVGDAQSALNSGEVHLAAGLYPRGTEFLNTLRYVSVSGSGDIEMAPRMKEIRYARKLKWLTYAELETLALDEVKERDDFPDRLKLPMGNLEDGVSNGVGWAYQGFIEDAAGDLRPQTFEETASCIGCHGGIGATTDSSFALARKLDSSTFQEGWHHWSQKDLTDVNEPKVTFQDNGVQYEYSYYLMYAGGGDGLSANSEVKATFLDDNRRLKPEMAKVLHEDISVLLYPSAERAMRLNKIYKTIVEEQSYTKGRMPLTAHKTEVFETLTAADLETGVLKIMNLTAHTRDKTCSPCTLPASEPASAAQQASVNGNGMGGPDGDRYLIDMDGFIDERTDYTTATQGLYFPFPDRHTLPTRMIVPLGNIPACYECHRLERAVPPENPVDTVAVELDSVTLEPDLDLVRLTDSASDDVNGAWSPDGSRIAWETNRSGAFQIWTMNSDGTDKKALTTGPAIHGWPEWSPDGSRLTYWGYNEASGTYSIHTISADGSDEKVLASSSEMMDRPVWHPEGTSIAWGAQTDGNWDIWVMDSTGAGDPIRLTHDAQMESNPLWRPDGSFIAYKVAPNKAYNLTLENFMDVSSGFDDPTVRVWDGIKSVQMNDWSPDGNYITYTAEIVTNASGEDRVSYLAVAEDVSFTGSKTSGTPVILSGHNTLGDRGPVFSPDGTRVAFWSWDTAYRATLWMADRDGGNLTQITRQGPDMTPQWHPSGGLLLFESARSGNMDIWTVAVD